MDRVRSVLRSGCPYTANQRESDSWLDRRIENLLHTGCRVNSVDASWEVRILTSDRPPNSAKWRHMPTVQLCQAIALARDIDADKVRWEYSREDDSMVLEDSAEFNNWIEIASAHVAQPNEMRPFQVQLLASRWKSGVRCLFDIRKQCEHC